MNNYVPPSPHALLVRVLAKLIAEHGAPNSFAPSEVTFGGGPAPMAQGLLVRRNGTSHVTADVARRLASGWPECSFPGLRVTYAKRRWIVDVGAAS